MDECIDRWMVVINGWSTLIGVSEELGPSKERLMIDYSSELNVIDLKKIQVLVICVELFTCEIPRRR